MSGIADAGREALARMDDQTLAAAAILAAMTLSALRGANPDAVAALLIECGRRLETRAKS